MDVRALLITGTVGSGKTSVADALGDVLAAAGIPHAVLDVDWLRRSWPTPAGDPFNQEMTLRNLRAVAGNFVGAGATRLVLAGVVESRRERDAYRAAVGAELMVCRLRVDPAVVRLRLTRRHEADPGRLPWFLDRAAELEDILDQAQVADFTVEATGASILEIARAVADGWR